MEGDIRRAMQRAERGARINPQVNTSGLASQASRAGRQFGDNFTNSAKTAMKALAAVTIGAGLVDQFKKVMSVGMDWTNNMNTLQAVTGATADQLKTAGEAARALGNDISLPATSANDAASAMTELAKGGFTVQQAMDAAKGSLALAAAAQISATDAATIQSQGLQAFGLQAADAGKMADTLANAANASSAEITDVAQAMAQAGTVANQFGLSAEDTAAAIALLANNGIKGSDAGTLLKSSLLALTDQGNPAQGAIEELGLTVYDAQGKFVGLHQLFQELGVASQSMSDEQYQAATAVLFGSDAMRLAGVAAKDGSASYDSMRVSIDRQGAAADVAAAKTRGLPGAWERVKNSLETLQLSAYDLMQGPLTTLADRVSSGLGNVIPVIQNAWRQLSSNSTVVSTFDSMVAAFGSLAGAAQEAWPALVGIGKSLGTAAAALAVGAWQAFVVAIQTAAGILTAIEPVLSSISSLMSDNQGVVVAAVGAWLLFKTVPGILTRVGAAVAPVTSAMSRATTVFRGFGDQMRVQQQLARMGGQNIGTFGAVVSTAASRASGALRSLRTAASTALSAVGGFAGLGVTAAIVAIGAIASSSGDAQRRTRELAETQGELNAKTKEMWDLLTATGGNVDENVIAKATEQFDVLQKKLDTLRTGAGIGDWLRGFGSDVFGIGDFDLGAAMEKQGTAEWVERIKGAMNDLGINAQQMGVLISGSAEAWSQFEERARAAGDGGRELLAEMEPLRQSFLDNQAAAKLLVPGFAGVRDAIKTIADEAATADEKTRAFKSALDALAGVSPDVQEATAQYNETIRNLSEMEVDPEELKRTPVSRNADGSVDTKSATGAQLYEALKQIKAGTEGVAGAATDVRVLNDTLTQSDQALQRLADQFGLTKPEVDAMAASMGYVPQTIETLFELKNADDTIQQVGLVKELLAKVPPNVPITMDAESVKSARGELERAGVKLREFDGPGGRKMIEMTFPNQEVLNNLQQVIDKAAQIPRKIDMYVDYNAGPTPSAGGKTWAGGRADGAIVPMAAGGFRQISKPRDADIYAGRGAGTVFAEEETGGEAYIPLAAGKRSRSRRILAEVARLFGMTVMAGGGIAGPTGQVASLAEQYGLQLTSGQRNEPGSFHNSGQAGDFSNGVRTDEMLAFATAMAQNYGSQLSELIYDDPRFNMEIKDGKVVPRSFYASAGDHTNHVHVALKNALQPTLGSGDLGSYDTLAAGGNMTGTQRRQLRDAEQKVEDKRAAVSSAEMALAELDTKTNVTAKQRLDRENALAKAQREEQDAIADLNDKRAEVSEKLSETGDSATGGMDASSFGQSLFSGLLQGMGLDGSVFSNPFDWPNVKSGMALANWGGGMLKAYLGQEGGPGGPVDLSGGGGGLPGLGAIPGMGALTTPINPNTTTHGQGMGQPPGPLVAYNGPVNLGVDPGAFKRRQDADMNQAYRRNMAAVKPG